MVKRCYFYSHFSDHRFAKEFVTETGFSITQPAVTWTGPATSPNVLLLMWLITAKKGVGPKCSEAAENYAIT